jgi:hypothetical protein
MIERDVWLAANQLLRLFGDDAPIQAAVHADTLQAQGDEQGRAVWIQVLRAIEELKSTEPQGAVI